MTCWRAVVPNLWSSEHFEVVRGTIIDYILSVILHPSQAVVCHTGLAVCLAIVSVVSKLLNLIKGFDASHLSYPCQCSLYGLWRLASFSFSRCFSFYGLLCEYVIISSDYICPLSFLDYC